MAILYEIDQAILTCCDQETGEIIDQERLDALTMERNSKIEAVALWIKNLQADAAALKAEKDAFADRQRKVEKKVEDLKAWLEKALQGKKFASTRCMVTWKPAASVRIVDEAAIPKKYQVKAITYRPDKKAIMAAINSGVNVKGVEKIITLNPQIK